MKNYLLLVMLLTLLSISVFSQKIYPDSLKTKQDYIDQSRMQRTAGYLLVVGGGIMAVVGASVWGEGFGEGFDFEGSDGSSKMSTGTALMITGAVATFGSIPLFIASHRSKKKAMSLSFRLQRIPNLQNTRLGNSNSKIPALHLKIDL